MFKIAHIRTIRHIFTSIMVILMLQIFTYDLVEKGEYVLFFNVLHDVYLKLISVKN